MTDEMKTQETTNQEMEEKAKNANASGTEENATGAEKGSEKKEATSFDDFLKQDGMQAEFDRRLAKAQETRAGNLKAEFEKLYNEKLEEQKRVAAMDASEKASYERQKLEKERDALRAELNAERLGKKASVSLSRKGIEASEEILSFVVGKDEEETEKRLSAFLSVVEKQVAEAEKKRNTGVPPKSTNTGANVEDDVFRQHLAKYQ